MIFDDCIVYYLNLDKDLSKKEKTTSELLKVFPNSVINRFPAILHKIGHIGCMMSHINLIKNALEQEKNNIFIFEDDIEWTCDINEFKNQINKINDYDIIALYYNIGYLENILEIDILDNNLGKIKNTRSAAGFLIKKSFIPKLLKV
jgi:GR25 family glycosyltransferase involved in LPS biosynthesis